MKGSYLDCEDNFHQDTHPGSMLHHNPIDLKTKRNVSNHGEIVISIELLAVQIVCHIDNIVQGLGHLIDGKMLQIPERSGSRDRHGLFDREAVLHLLEEI